MPEDQKSSFSEAVETGASAAHTIRGAIKTGKAISSAAKGAAAGGPYGAVAGAVWAGRKHYRENHCGSHCPAYAAGIICSHAPRSYFRRTDQCLFRHLTPKFRF